ncbi:MAG: hypothetical protein GY927_03155 [bacterium]|nr:hypothetical protein [bacterium]
MIGYDPREERLMYRFWKKLKTMFKRKERIVYVEKEVIVERVVLTPPPHSPGLGNRQQKPISEYINSSLH